MTRYLSVERTFSGRSRINVKRDVLSFWHQHHTALGLSLKQFLNHCRETMDGGTVVIRFDPSLPER